jgi:nucleoside-diphosphate-sugar epimerase
MYSDRDKLIMKVSIVGATGKYVSHVIPELKQRGAIVRALVREKDQLDAARHQGGDGGKGLICSALLQTCLGILCRLSRCSRSRSENLPLYSQ